MAQTLLDSPSLEAQVNQVFTEADFAPYDGAVDDLLTLGLGSVATSWRAVEDQSAEVIRDELLAAVPDATSTFGPQISDVAAIEYQDLRSAAGVTSRHESVVTPPPQRSRTNALVRWAVKPLFTPAPDTAQMWSLLAGGLVRVLLDQQRQTMIDNAVDDIIDGPTAYQRVPRPGCCAFCAMLASQHAVYGGSTVGSRVVGRGAPLDPLRQGSGRRPGGIAPRGTRDIGDEFHDYCRCRTVPVFRSTAVALADDAEGYLEEYHNARRALDDQKVLDWTQTKSDDGSLRRRYFWSDRKTGEPLPGDLSSMTLRWMRQQTGRR